MMNKAQIDYAMVSTKLSAVLGRKWGVNVVFGGHPCTNGTTITLPHWDLTDPRLRTALYGLIAHEAGGHVRQTDFQALGAKITAMRRSPLMVEWKSIANILEDIRIEANLLRSYPGAAAYLNAAVEVMLADPDDNRPLPDEITNYWDLVLNWCLYIFRAECLGQVAISGDADLYEAAVLNVLPPEVLADARKIGVAVSKLGPSKTDYSTVQMYADKLLALFNDNMPSKQSQKSPDPQGSQGQQGGSQGSQGQQGGSQGSQGQQDGSQGSQGQQGGSQGSQGQQDGSQGSQGQQDGSQGSKGQQDGSQGSQGQQGSGQTGGSSQPLEETGATQEIGDIFRALADKGASKDSAVIALPHIGATDKAPANPMLRDAVLLHARRAKAMTQSLVAALSPMLCGDMEYSANSKSGNRINQSRITRAITDRDPALFRKIHIEEDQSVAVQILIDTSGSTSGAVLDAEIVSALGIASALEHFQDVETAISHFPGSAWAGRMVHAPFIQAFGQPVTSCYAKWPTATGGTPLADAYVSAWFNFLHSEKQRKILIVLTDGMPDNAQAAAKEKAKLTRLGVEVYGVIISKQPYPAGMFDDSEQISSPNALPRSLSALVRRNL